MLLYAHARNQGVGSRHWISHLQIADVCRSLCIDLAVVQPLLRTTDRPFENGHGEPEGLTVG